MRGGSYGDVAKISLATLSHTLLPRYYRFHPCTLVRFTYPRVNVVFFSPLRELFLLLRVAIGLKSWRKKVDSRNSKFTSMSFGVFSSIFLVLFCSRFFLFFFSFLIAYTFELFFIDVSTILTRRIISSRKSYFVATIFRCDRSFLGNTIASLIANQLRS